MLNFNSLKSQILLPYIFQFFTPQRNLATFCRQGCNSYIEKNCFSQSADCLHSEKWCILKCKILGNCASINLILATELLSTTSETYPISHNPLSLYYWTQWVSLTRKRIVWFIACDWSIAPKPAFSLVKNDLVHVSSPQSSKISFLTALRIFCLSIKQRILT